MRSVLAALALALALSACTGEDPGGDEAPGGPSASSSETAPTAKRPRAPRQGACYRLRLDDALSPTTTRKPVPCRRRHTAQTFHVGRLDLKQRGRTRRVDAPAVQRQPARRCPARLPGFLSGSRDQLRLSMLTAVWFTPTLPDAEAGARWFRCDVVVLGRGGALVPLRIGLRGALADPDLRERFAMCATAAPGTKGFRRVPCGQRHSWRAVQTVDLPGRRYPPAPQMTARMDAPCTAAAQEYADDPLDYTWAEERPTRSQWRAGQHYGTCWVPQN
ncbi:septum formation family protein [Nocardioides sp. 616]|uniref:septum formation family protein n=1 Tax=Nocardioides sp. 616 TaxID=2268090 RepID=UPI000CE44AEF|nr:septum formation family protein [Nocardioides sp. 616]